MSLCHFEGDTGTLLNEIESIESPHVTLKEIESIESPHVTLKCPFGFWQKKGVRDRASWGLKETCDFFWEM